ncbi:MAG: thiol-disulfide oxidoreductase ResA [Thermoactinomyces sp.]|jgi:peroxiredoxin
MNKQTRYWVRRVLFLFMVALVGLALYQAMNRDHADKPDVGETAPDFQLETLDGKQMKLSDFKGKAVLLNFWGSWCDPCRKEMPVLEQAYKEYKNKGFTIVAVNIAETNVAASAFARQYGLTFPILMDRDRDVVDLYKVGPIPTSLLIDPKGKITKRVEGPLIQGQLELYINSILPRH